MINGSKSSAVFANAPITYDNAQLNLPMELAIALRLDDRYDPIHKFGRNNDVDETAFEDIRMNGDLGVFLEEGGGQPMEIVSDSADDTLAGTGAQKVELYMIADDGKSYSVEVEMNGTTAVAISTTDADGNTVNSWIYCNEAIVSASGSGETNAGNITIQTTSAATPASTEIQYINAGDGRDHSAIFYVSSDYSGFMFTNVDMSTTKNEAVEFKCQYTYNGTWISAFHTHLIADRGTKPYRLPKMVPSSAYIKVQAIGVTANSEVTAEIDGFGIH